MDVAEKRGSASEKILNTALELIAARGYANVSMRDIADAAGVALSQLTYYYKNKEGLVCAVIENICVTYMDQIVDAVEKAKTPEEQVEATAKFFKTCIDEDDGLLRLIVDFSATAMWSKPIFDLLSALFEGFAVLIGSNFGWLQDPEKMKVARFVLGAFYGTAVQSVLGMDRERAKEAIDYGTRLFLKEIHASRN